MPINLNETVVELIKEGYTKQEIESYVKGSHDGFVVFKEFIDLLHKDIEKNETDPIYFHTWNKVINDLSFVAGQTIKSIYEDLPDKFKPKNE